MMAFVTDVKLASNGRMVLPQAVREAMGVSGETRIIVTVDSTDVRLSPIANVVTKLQALYREHVKHDVDARHSWTNDGPMTATGRMPRSECGRLRYVRRHRAPAG